jgi:hypothetical protein
MPHYDLTEGWAIDDDGVDVLLTGPGGLEISLPAFDVARLVHEAGLSPVTIGSLRQLGWTYPLGDVDLHLGYRGSRPTRRASVARRECGLLAAPRDGRDPAASLVRPGGRRPSVTGTTCAPNTFGQGIRWWCGAWIAWGARCSICWKSSRTSRSGRWRCGCLMASGRI